MQSTQRYGIGLLIAALAGVGSVLAAPDLPAEIAIHWDASGTANDYAPKAVGLALVPVLAVAMLGLFAVLPRIDPLGENIREFRAAYDWFVVLVVGLLAYAHGLLLAANLGWEFELTQALAPALAVLYMAMGVLFQQAKRNWFVGFRTPWTLSDDAVWNRTHEHAGRLLAPAGVLALGAVFVPEYATYFLVAPAVVVTLYATAFSYVDYSRNHDTA